MFSAGKIFIIVGLSLLIFGGYLIYQRYSPKKLSFDNFSSQTTNLSSISPKEIIIPNIKVDLSVFPAAIKNNTWEATTQGVSYLTSTPLPGTMGNSIIYGHNWTSLLGSLPKIKPGDKITIILNNHEQKNFVVKFTSIVSPSETEILANSTDSRITIYTCTGFLDSKRFVAVAERI